MSFARILSDFKHIQKSSRVISMAQKYETFTRKKRVSSPKLNKRRHQSEAEKAQELINREKRRRGLSTGTAPPISVYIPPKFTDNKNTKNIAFRRKRANADNGDGTKSLPG